MSNEEKILSANPHANYLAHKAEIDTAVLQVLASGWYILGEEVTAFEQEFAAWIGAQHAIGVANGTDALELALRACDIGPGDAVLTVSNTAVATVAAIERCGAIPLFVDIEPQYYTMDPDCLEETLALLVKERPAGVQAVKAIIPVHLYGHPADMPRICEIAARHHLFIIEDCAQAHGAAINGGNIGTWGDMAAFSLYPTKNLGALGDGGVIVTNDARLDHNVRLLRQYGWEQRYISLIPGVNSRLDPVQAAILRVKLRYLDSDNKRRRDHAQTYQEQLSDMPLVLPATQKTAVHAYHQYVVRSQQREKLQAHLQTHGIGTQILYPTPIHLQPAYLDRLPLILPLPVTEALAAEIFTLPVYPELEARQIAYVAHSIRSFFE